VTRVKPIHVGFVSAIVVVLAGLAFVNTRHAPPNLAAPVVSTSTRSTAESGIEFTSTKFSEPFANDAAAMRRPLTRVSVDVVPRPRSDTPANPAGESSALAVKGK